MKILAFFLGILSIVLMLAKESYGCEMLYDYGTGKSVCVSSDVSYGEEVTESSSKTPQEKGK